MIDYKYFNLFQYEKGNVNKDWKIEYDGGSFTDWDLFSESIELKESLCSEKELRFGCCEAGCLKFKVANIVKPLINEWITVSVIIGHHEEEPFIVGRYKVASEKLTADRQYKDIVAYDIMHDIITADVVDWYNAVLPEKTSTVTLRQFRTSFMQHFGISEQVPECGLVNDDMVVNRTILPEQISGKDVITAICEINGCFGHIGRDGKFHYIYLPQAIEGLYPANDLFPDRAPKHMTQAKSDHLYPQDPQSTRIGAGTYIECSFEDYITQSITKLQIRREENDIGVVYGNGNNCYIIQDNFLVYGKTAEQLDVIARKLFEKITNIMYRPFNADVMGNPCMEVGDPVRLPTKYEIVETYILERTLKGIQALRDHFKAEGAKEHSENVNSVSKSIVQLKGKTNVLTRTIEETRLEMNDVEKELSNKILITAEKIQGNLKDTQAGMESLIKQTASEIRGEVTDVENSLSAQIRVNADNISLKVDAEGVVAAINLTPETATIKANRIDLVGLVNADELVGKFATIKTLNATNLRVKNLEGDHVSVEAFEAEKARINTIESSYITAKEVKTDYMEVQNWTYAGKIKADRIDVSVLEASISRFQKTVTMDEGLSVAKTASVGKLVVAGLPVTWVEITVNNTTYKVLGRN